MLETLKKLGGQIIGGIKNFIESDTKSRETGFLAMPEKTKQNQALARETVKAIPSTAVQIAKNTPAAAKQIGSKILDTALSIVVPTSTPEERKNPGFLFEVAKGIPGAVIEGNKQVITHPIKSAQGFVGGIARGISNATTDIIINNLVPQKDRGATRDIVKETLDKYLTPPDSFFTEGAEIGGSATPFIGGGLAGRAAAGAAGLGVTGMTISEIIAAGGVGQLGLEREASIEQRTEQALNDLITLGIFEAGGFAYRKAKPLVKEAIVKSTEVAKDAYDAYQKLTPAEKQGGFIRNPLGENQPKSISTKRMIEEATGIKDSSVDTISKKEDMVLRDRVRSESRGAKETAKVLKSEFKTELKDVASEQFGRGEVTGFFKGEQEGRVLGKKIGEFTTRKEFQAKIIDIKKSFNDKSKSQALMRESVRQFVEENLPLNERGKFINAAANTKTPGELNNQFKRAVKAADKYRELQATQKAVNTRMQKIGFIKKIGEFSNTLVRDIKTKLGIEGPLRDMTPEQLDLFIDEAKARLEFKKDRGAFDERTTSIGDEAYNEAFNLMQNEKKISTRLKGKAKDAAAGIKSAAGDIASVISTRLKNIDPSLRVAMRQFEYKLSTQKAKQLTEVTPFLEKASTLSERDFSDLDFALKNRQKDKAMEIAKKNGMEAEIKNVQEKVLPDIYKQAKDIGVDTGFLEDYWPRRMDDLEGYLQYIDKKIGSEGGAINDAIQAKEMEIGAELSDAQKVHIIDMMLRGKSYNGISIAKAGNFKERQIDMLDPELNRFYKDSSSALLDYILETTDYIEASKFFGKDIKAENAKMEDIIGTYVLNLLKEKKLPMSAERELTKILDARFNQRGITNKVINGYRNMEYVANMGNPISAITQIGDLAFSAYLSPRDFVGAAKDVVLGKGKINREMLGINGIAKEFGDSSGLAKAVDFFFKWSGLEMADAFGKNTLIQTAYRKYQRAAKDVLVNGKERTSDMQRIKDAIGNNPADLKATLEDLAAGKVTDRTKYLMFNELSNFQPITYSELPAGYLKSGNWRVAYQFKSYAIKQIDVIRNEAIADMKKPDAASKIKGFKNLMGLTTSLIAANATADTIKNLVLNRPTEVSDLLADNLFKLMGFNKYIIYQVKKEGLGTAASKQLLPSFKVIDSLWKDFTQSKAINEKESISAIPLGGKLYYWWFGKGATNSDKKRSESGGNDLGLPSLDLGLSAKDLGIDGISGVDLGFTAEDLGL